MHDRDGPRSPARRPAPTGDRRPLRGALVPLVAAGILAAAVLAAVLATPPASADAPAQVEPAVAVESTGEDAGTPASARDSRALAWWMAGEVGVLVLGGAIWCHRATRRQAMRRDAAGAGTGTTVTRPSRRDSQPPERRPSPRFRL